MHVVLVVTLGSGPVDTSSHLLTTLRAAVLAAVIVVNLPFLFPPLLLLLILCLIIKILLVGHAKELHHGNVDYVIVVISLYMPWGALILSLSLYI